MRFDAFCKGPILFQLQVWKFISGSRFKQTRRVVLDDGRQKKCPCSTSNWPPAALNAGPFSQMSLCGMFYHWKPTSYSDDITLLNYKGLHKFENVTFDDSMWLSIIPTGLYLIELRARNEKAEFFYMRLINEARSEIKTAFWYGRLNSKPCQKRYKTMKFSSSFEVKAFEKYEKKTEKYDIDFIQQWITRMREKMSKYMSQGVTRQCVVKDQRS